MPNDGRSKAEVRESLPEPKRAIFDSLVLDYQESASQHSKKPWVNYRILADLVRAGWCKGEPLR